jgi:hypothetical protein
VEQKVPASVYETIRLVPGLKKGRCEAKESDPVLPVPREVVEATLKILPATVADMVKIQLITGCRPGGSCPKCAQR